MPRPSGLSPCGLRTIDYRLPTPDYRLPTPTTHLHFQPPFPNLLFQNQQHEEITPTPLFAPVCSGARSSVWQSLGDSLTGHCPKRDGRYLTSFVYPGRT